MAVCGAFVNILDLECLFVNIFSGTPVIFGIIALIVIAILAATFRMGTPVAGALVMVFAIIFKAYIGAIFWLIIVLGSMVLLIPLINAWVKR